MRASERAAILTPVPVIVRGGLTRLQRTVLVVLVVILGVLISIVLGQAVRNGEDTRRAIGTTEGVVANNRSLLAAIEAQVAAIEEQGSRIATLEAALRAAGVAVPGDPPPSGVPVASPGGAGAPSVPPVATPGPRGASTSGGGPGGGIASFLPRLPAPAPVTSKGRVPRQAGPAGTSAKRSGKFTSRPARPNSSHGGSKR